jgi:hypothetical protein
MSRPRVRGSFGIADHRVQERENFAVAALVPAVTGEVLNRPPIPLRLDDRFPSLVEKVEQLR